MKNTLSKICLVLILILGLVIISVSIYHKKDATTNHISLGEVTHSPFYAPLYVAIENGYFSDENIEIDLSLVSGANNVLASLLSDSIDIGFCGPEATIYVYNGGEKDFVQSFAGLTKRDGQFLVSRVRIEDFSWDMLKGSEVLAGRTGGMPVLSFLNALENEGIDIKDVNINTSIDFASLTGAFIGGEGDFVNLFEPNVTKLINMGYGYVASSIGESSLVVPYTAFNARKSYIEEHTDLLKRFVRAIDRGLEFTSKSSARKIADTIIGQFPDMSINDLEVIIDRYKSIDSWLDTSKIEEYMFTNLEDIMISSHELDEYVPFEDLVININ